MNTPTPLLVSNNLFITSIMQGFTLLEVMISVLVLTTSLLGVTGMYGFATKFSYEAQQQAQAVYVANDILEILRIDKSIWLHTVLKEKGSLYQINVSADKTVPPCEYNCGNTEAIKNNIAAWQDHFSIAFSFIPSSACLILQRQGFTQTIHTRVIINWYIPDFKNKPEISILKNNCGGTGNRRRQFIVQTLL